jgi:hypothetical protein
MNKKLTHSEFIKLLLIKNGDYKNKLFTVESNYVKSNIKIIVKNKFGLCKVRPNLLLNNTKIGIGSAINKEEYFIKIFNKIHNNFYTYDKFKYKKMIDKVIITCKIHGDFNQNVRNHINGQGCKKCSVINRNYKNDFKSFCLKANKKFNNLYVYNSDSFVDWYSKINITCKKHGEFSISPRFHLQSNGCPKCSFENLTGGYTITLAKRNKLLWNKINAKFYLVECSNNNELFYKIGITKKEETKYRFSGKQFPYNVKILLEYKTSLYNSIYLERYYLNKFINNKYIPLTIFNGYTECLKIDLNEINEILNDDFSEIIKKEINK